MSTSEPNTLPVSLTNWSKSFSTFNLCLKLETVALSQLYTDLFVCPTANFAIPVLFQFYNMKLEEEVQLFYSKKRDWLKYLKKKSNVILLHQPFAFTIKGQASTKSLYGMGDAST